MKQGHRQHAAELLLEALDMLQRVGKEPLLNTIGMRGAGSQAQLKPIDDITSKAAHIKQIHKFSCVL